MKAILSSLPKLSTLVHFYRLILCQYFAIAMGSLLSHTCDKSVWEQLGGGGRGSGGSNWVLGEWVGLRPGEQQSYFFHFGAFSEEPSYPFHSSPFFVSDDGGAGGGGGGGGGQNLNYTW